MLYSINFSIIEILLSFILFFCFSEHYEGASILTFGTSSFLYGKSSSSKRISFPNTDTSEKFAVFIQIPVVTQIKDIHSVSTGVSSNENESFTVEVKDYNENTSGDFFTLEWMVMQTGFYEYEKEGVTSYIISEIVDIKPANPTITIQLAYPNDPKKKLFTVPPIAIAQIQNTTASNLDFRHPTVVVHDVTLTNITFSVQSLDAVQDNYRLAYLIMSQGNVIDSTGNVALQAFNIVQKDKRFVGEAIYQSHCNYIVPYGTININEAPTLSRFTLNTVAKKNLSANEVDESLELVTFLENNSRGSDSVRVNIDATEFQNYHAIYRINREYCNIFTSEVLKPFSSKETEVEEPTTPTSSPAPEAVDKISSVPSLPKQSSVEISTAEIYEESTISLALIATICGAVVVVTVVCAVLIICFRPLYKESNDLKKSKVKSAIPSSTFSAQRNIYH